MDRTDRPNKTDRHMTKDLGAELLLYDTAGDQIHVLNGTAREICLRCDGSHSVEDLVQAVVSGFEVEESTARNDVEETLDRLTQLGAITLNPSQPQPV